MLEVIKRFGLPTLKSLCFIALFILFWEFYFYEQWTTFNEKSTAFRSRIENVPSIDISTYILCWEPTFKPSVVQKYGITSLYKIVEDRNETYAKYDLSPQEFYDEFAYKFGRDFDLYFKLDSRGVSSVKFHEGRNTFGNQNVTIIIDLRSVVTIGSGTCAVIEVQKQMKMSVGRDFVIDIKFNQSLPSGDIPSGFKIIVASNSSWLGFVTDDSPYFEPTQIDLKFNPELKYFIKFTSPSKIIYRNGNKNVTKCVEDVFRSLDCKVICYPLFFNYLTDFRWCKNYAEFACIEEKLYVESEKNRAYQQCLKPTERFEYKWRVSQDVIAQKEKMNKIPFNFFIIFSVLKFC